MHEHCNKPMEARLLTVPMYAGLVKTCNGIGILKLIEDISLNGEPKVGVSGDSSGTGSNLYKQLPVFDNKDDLAMYVSQKDIFADSADDVVHSTSNGQKK